MREKNLLLADRIGYEKAGSENTQMRSRLEKVKASMRRILGVVAER